MAFLKQILLQLGGVLVALFCCAAQGRGVTPYLPIGLDPQLEAQIERVLILGDRAVLTRPIPAAAVLDALPKACLRDDEACIPVRRYLAQYMQSVGITDLNVELAASTGSDHVLPNRYGMTSSSAWQAVARLHWQPSDYVLMNLGGISYDGDSMAADSFVSVGMSYAQLDIGYRQHWLSPLTQSSMLLSTEAPSMASATLSNYTPMTRLGLRYELTAARLSSSSRIRFGDQLTAGRPKLLGVHLSIEPAKGWSLGVNRLMQFGGGARDGSSFKDIFRAFFNPSRFDNSSVQQGVNQEFGNQVGSFTSRFIFPGRTPFAIYMEYAGEDTSRGRSYLLGNSALSAGVDFPLIWHRFNFTYEVSEWQNAWYVNGIYGDGLTNEGHVLGHWGADQRRFGDGVGAQSHMARIGWDPAFGGAMELRLRTLRNESYSAVDYRRANDLTLRYSYPFNAFTLGAEATKGRDVLGDNYSRFALFVRLADNAGRRANEDTGAQPPVEGANLIIDAGVSVHSVNIDLARATPRSQSRGAGAHLGLGARRKVSDHNDLGVRVELDDIDGHMLMAFRAVDYRYRFHGPLAIGAFLGAARYDLATPAYGLYGGVGLQWQDLFKGWDLGLDARYAMKVARDRLLPSDPESTRPDQFYDISSATLSISRRF